MLDCRALRSGLLLILGFVASSGLAQSLDVLGPSGLVPPDGFAVALIERDAKGAPVALTGPSLALHGADAQTFKVEPPLSGYWLVPNPGATEVKLKASHRGLSVERVFRVGPPSARVQLSIDPPSPVKNRDATASLTIQLLRSDGSPDPRSSPPVLRSNVGALSAIERVAPGKFRATYELPKTVYPEVAIIAAFAPWPSPQSIHGAYGALMVPLATSVNLPGHTEARAQITVEIAGRKFGPAASDATGEFSLPVVVPPGHRFGTGTTVDRFGNKRVRPIDLMLPPTNQLACVSTPTRVPSDGVSHARVLCAASDPSGKPVSSARVAIAAKRGTVGAARSLEAGLFEWIYTAPRGLFADPDTLSATWRQAGALSHQELAIDLEQGPASRVTLQIRSGPVHHGGALDVAALVADSLGRPRAGTALRWSASEGVLEGSHEVAPGRWQARWLPADVGAWGEATVSAEATGPTGSDPARLIAWPTPEGVAVGVTDLAGLPVPKQRLTLGERTVETSEQGIAQLGPLSTDQIEISHAQWPDLRLTLHRVNGERFFPTGSPLIARASVGVPLAPPAPVVVRVLVKQNRVTYWLESAKGEVLRGRAVKLTLSSGTATPEVDRDGERTFSVDASEPVTVSISDVATGVTAFAEVSR